MDAPYRRITVAIDGSANALNATRFAIAIARGSARLRLLAVVDDVAACLPEAEGAVVDPGPLLAALADEADASLLRAQLLGEHANLETTSVVVHGRPADGVLSDASHADLIVMGTQGRAGIARVLFGSVAEAVVRQSPVPVVAVHGGDANFEGPIALAYDATPAADAALHEALRIARAFDVPLVVVHATPDRAAGTDPTETLTQAARRAAEAGVTTKLVQLRGEAASAVIRAAHAEHARLIVTGTHGHLQIERMFIGSVASGLLERAHVPVLSVAPAAIPATR
jgi:nucleotide-binding universal stress UspA family protein